MVETDAEPRDPAARSPGAHGATDDPCREPWLPPNKASRFTARGDSGGTRPFTFMLKTELPAEMYEALWRATNPASLAGPDDRPAPSLANDAFEPWPGPVSEER